MVESTTRKKQLVAELSDIRHRIAEIEESVVYDEHPDQLLESLFLNLPAATYVNVDGVFRFTSAQFRQITGRSDSELLGTSPFNLILQDDRESAREHITQAIRGEQSSVHEFRIVAKNANIKWVMEAASPIIYEGRRGVIAILVDITRRKRAEEAVRSKEERYHDLCENASDMIQCIAPDARLLYVNRSCREALGYNEDEITNLSLFDIMPRDYVEHYLRLFQRLVSGEDVSNNIEAVFINRNGHRFTVEGNINCRFIDNKPVYMRGIFRDVTERKQAQEEAEALINEVQEINQRLEQSNRELEDFAHIASHDLQEPLRKISSFSKMLQVSLEDKLDEDDLENLGFVIEGAGRMQSMIYDLLTYSRLTTKAKPFQTVDPNEVIENLKNFELSDTLNDTEGTIHVPEPLLAIHGDPSQIHQLFQNLIANGLKFHRDGVPPIITVSSHPAQNNLVHFNVQDNGIGINEEYFQQIFVMFKRLHSRESYQGTGIGLAICKKIVERHGGHIGVESTPGQGTTFWFTLPRFASTDNEQPGGNRKDE